MNLATGTTVLLALLVGVGAVSVGLSVALLRRGKLYYRLRPEARPRRWVLVAMLVLAAVFIVWFPVWLLWPQALVARLLLGLFGATFGALALTLKWFSPLVDAYVRRRGWPLR